MNKQLLALLFAAGLIPSASGATFYPIAAVDSSTSATDLWPVSNLIQGPGVGYDAAEPHVKLASDAQGNWVTADPGGFPSDYIEAAGAPVVTLDLGVDQILGEISMWGYSDGNTNGVSAFELRFASEADGAGNFGTSITDNPAFSGMVRDAFSRQSFTFSQVNARYVELTLTDNLFVAPGNVAPDAGGDRVGFGEVAFQVVPEPSTFLLGAIGLFAIFRRRSRS